MVNFESLDNSGFLSNLRSGDRNLERRYHKVVSLQNQKTLEEFSMKITDLIISPESLGAKLWLVDVAPVYAYVDNRRTDTVTAYRYTVCMPDKNFDKIGIKIDGKPQAEKPQGYAEVTFANLEIFVYWLNGQPQVGAKATGISLVNHKA